MIRLIDFVISFVCCFLGSRGHTALRVGKSIVFHGKNIIQNEKNNQSKTILFCFVGGKVDIGTVSDTTFIFDTETYDLMVNYQTNNTHSTYQHR
jgi:hypothetical protein